jgi:hypothetical protein
MHIIHLSDRDFCEHVTHASHIWFSPSSPTRFSYVLLMIADKRTPHTANTIILLYVHT